MGRPIIPQALAAADALNVDQVRRLYRRVIAGWAGDLLRGSGGLRWPEPAADDVARNWRGLYRGSVLDD